MMSNAPHGWFRRRSRIWAGLVAAILPMVWPVGNALGGDSASPSSAEQTDEAIAAYEEQARAAGALGFYTDQQTGSLVVLVPATGMDQFDTSMGGKPPIDVAVQPTSYDGRTLEMAREQLAVLVENNPHNSMAFGFDPRLGRLEVSSTLDLSLVSSTLTAYPLIDYRAASVELANSRQANTAPFWGGAGYSDSPQIEDCTTGMAVLQNGGTGTAALVTAGHCYSNGTSVYTPAGAKVGNVSNRTCGYSTGNDMALIAGKTYAAQIFLGGANSSTHGPVINAGNPAEGLYYYNFSGAASGEWGPYEVVNSDFQYWNDPTYYPNCPYWVNHVSAFRRLLYGEGGYYSWCDAQKGDSGAPFYYKYASNNIGIRGMLTAFRSDFQYCFAENWDRIASQLNVAIDR